MKKKKKHSWRSDIRMYETMYTKEVNVAEPHWPEEGVKIRKRRTRRRPRKPYMQRRSAIE
jgi:hypothetical protein